MKIRPLFDRVLIEQTTTSSTNQKCALVIPESSKEKPLVANVIAVGGGEEKDGKTIPMKVSIGDKILFSKYAGNEFKIDGREVIIIRQSDILAIVEEDKENKK